mgnify:FL=1
MRTTKKSFSVRVYYTPERKRDFYLKVPSRAKTTWAMLERMKKENPNAFCIVVSFNGENEEQWLNPNYSGV